MHVSSSLIRNRKTFSSPISIILPFRNQSSANQFNCDTLKEKVTQSSGVITTPVRLLKKADKLRRKELERLALYHKNYAISSNSRMIIDCLNDKRLRHYEQQQYPSSKSIPLVTQYWKNKKYNKSVLVVRNTLGINPSMVHRTKDRLRTSSDSVGSSENSITNFQELNLDEVIKSTLCQNFGRPTNAQALSIPVICSGKNLILAAETGSGKTVAYLAPLIHKLHRLRVMKGAPKSGAPRAIILAPSRELVTQIFRVLKDFCSGTEVDGIKIVDRNSLYSEPTSVFDVIVATPGSIARLQRDRIINFEALSTVVLDEADTLLDDSFRDLILSVLQHVQFRTEAPLNKGCQLLLISATFPSDLDTFLGSLPELQSFERITTTYLHKLQPQVTHKFVRVLKSTRLEQMLILAKSELKEKRNCLVFVNDNKTGVFLHNFLQNSNVPCQFLHRRSQNVDNKYSSATLRAIDDFNTEKSRFLISTDLGSRGLDTRSAEHVINFNFPRTLAEYLHRAGRLGRSGVALPTSPYLCTSFVADPGDVKLVQRIEMAVRLNGGRLPDIFDNVKKRFAERMKLDDSGASQMDLIEKENRNEEWEENVIGDE